MYICICNAVTEADVRRCVAEGARNFDALRVRTGCSDCCGSCEPSAREVLDSALKQQRWPLRVVSSAA